jgi:hypothetical protein
VKVSPTGAKLVRMRHADFVAGYASAVDRMMATKAVRLDLAPTFLTAWRWMGTSLAADTELVQIGPLPTGAGSATLSVAEKNSRAPNDPRFFVKWDHKVEMIARDLHDALLAHGAKKATSPDDEDDE